MHCKGHVLDDDYIYPIYKPNKDDGSKTEAAIYTKAIYDAKRLDSFSFSTFPRAPQSP